METNIKREISKKLYILTVTKDKKNSIKLASAPLLKQREELWDCRHAQRPILFYWKNFYNVGCTIYLVLLRNLRSDNQNQHFSKTITSDVRPHQCKLIGSSIRKICSKWSIKYDITTSMNEAANIGYLIKYIQRDILRPFRYMHSVKVKENSTA